MSSSYLQTLNHRHVDSSTSTNTELIDQVQSGTLDASRCHLLTADSQTAGRGQYTRSWQSPRGNVYLSLYHPITIPVSGLLSLIIGLSLANMPVIKQLNQALTAVDLTPIGVKWANDLGFYPPIADNKNDLHFFKKLAGILIEPVWQSGTLIGVVIGVGLNVTSAPKLTTKTLEGMSYQAVSLADICNEIIKHQPEHHKPIYNSDSIIRPPALPALYSQIAYALCAAMTRFIHISAEISGQAITNNEAITDNQTQTSSQASPKMTAFLQAFAQSDALIGYRLRVTQNHQGKLRTLYGVAAGIDTNGCLQLRQDNGTISTLFSGRIDVIPHH